MSNAQLFARLCAHWPSLAGDDAYAEVRARDWLSAMDRIGPTVRAAVDELISSWSGPPPHIADLQETARQHAYHDSFEGPSAIEAPTIDRARFAQLVEQARQHLRGGVLVECDHQEAK